MGPCSNPSLYQTYLGKGELYMCGMAEQIYNWAKDQDEDYCTWGFGELAPPGNSKNAKDYILTDK
jgi:hypothetical protein